MKQDHELGNPNVRRALLEVNHGVDDHEEESHPDERWLVSYADMMTLLFGLFVLLFSMATLKKDQADAIRQSTEEQFSKPEATKEKSKPSVESTETLQKQLEQLTAAAVERESKILDQAVELKNLKISLERRAKEQADQRTAFQELSKQIKDKTPEAEYLSRIADLEKRSEMLESQNRKLMSSEQRSTQLEADLKLAEKNEKERSQSSLELDRKIEELERQNQNLKETAKRELASVNKASEFEQKFQSSEKVRRELEMKISELEKSAQKADAGAGLNKEQSFIAFFINWSTKDHDIDMTIEDPNGKTFDFKKRKYPGEPGLFALDTRRGPGAELWQSDRLIPGIYKATYLFYNQYGNNSAAKVSGTIFTPKGSVEVPAVEMTIDHKRRHQISFEVKKEGGVKILENKAGSK
jgi:flagellar motor protein MotB